MEPPDELDFGFHDFGPRGKPVEVETHYIAKKTNYNPIRKTISGQRLKLGETFYIHRHLVELEAKIVHDKEEVLSEEDYMVAKLKGETEKWLHSSAW